MSSHSNTQGIPFPNDGTLDRKITARIQKASQASGRLCIKVLQHKSISLSTKLKVYNETPSCRAYVFPFSQTLAERRVCTEKLRNHKTSPTYLNVETESMMASMHSSSSWSLSERSALTSSLCVMGRRQSL